MSKSNNNNYELTDSQIEILAAARRLEGEGVKRLDVVPEATTAALSKLDATGEIESMANPVIVDAGAVDTEALRSAVETFRQVGDPVVVDRPEAEALESAKRGLRRVVTEAYDLSEGAAEAMSAEALANAAESV